MCLFNDLPGDVWNHTLRSTGLVPGARGSGAEYAGEVQLYWALTAAWKSGHDLDHCSPASVCRAIG